MKTLTDEKLTIVGAAGMIWFEYGSDSHHDGTYF